MIRQRLVFQLPSKDEEVPPNLPKKVSISNIKGNRNLKFTLWKLNIFTGLQYLWVKMVACIELYDLVKSSQCPKSQVRKLWQIN